VASHIITFLLFYFLPFTVRLCKDTNYSANTVPLFLKKFTLNIFKRFGWSEKNEYLCTVKNASAGLKSALNAKFAIFGLVKL